VKLKIQTIKLLELRMERLKKEIHLRFRFSKPETAHSVVLAVEAEMRGEVMNVPVDGPHLEAG